MDKISIIVPVWKDVQLDRTISSLVNQSYKNLEIILVDDGAQGQAPEICDKWAQKDQRVRVVHKKNGGICSARNVGLNVATGSYLAFCDDDDTYQLDAFQTYYDLIHAYNADIAWADAKVINDDGSVCREENEYTGQVEVRTQEEEIRHFLKYKNTTVWGGLYKKEVFEGICFDESVISHEDFLVLGKLFQRIRKIVFYDKPLYNYYMYGFSVSHNLSTQHILCQLDVAERIEKMYIQTYTNETITYKMVLYNSIVALIDTDIKENVELKKNLLLYMRKNWPVLMKVDLHRRKNLKTKIIICSICPFLYDIKKWLKKKK